MVLSRIISKPSGIIFNLIGIKRRLSWIKVEMIQGKRERPPIISGLIVGNSALSVIISEMIGIKREVSPDNREVSAIKREMIGIKTPLLPDRWPVIAGRLALQRSPGSWHHHAQEGRCPEKGMPAFGIAMVGARPLKQVGSLETAVATDETAPATCCFRAVIA